MTCLIISAASPVDSILEKDDFTLEELLDEDELIQECKSLNARLTAYLKQADTVEKLLSYLVDEPPEDADAKRQFKYPFSACEIFCCEVEGIFNTLLESDELLDRLFGILRRPRPLNSMLAGYFARVVGSLLLRRSADTMQYLQRNKDILALLVSHVDTTSVAEVLVRLMGADDPRGFGVAGALEWLEETELLKLLVRQLGPEGVSEAQANAAEVLAAVARSTGSPLTRKMASKEFMTELVEAALAPHEGQAATHALNVCIALIEPPPAQDSPMGLGSPDETLQEELRAQAIHCISMDTTRLVAMLENSEIKELKTSYGCMKPPVGQLRLKAVDLLATLLRTADQDAEEAIIASKGVERAMELFIKYPFNNALHGSVAALLTSFEPGSDMLREFLLKDAHLVDWLISAPEEVDPEAPENSLVSCKNSENSSRSSDPSSMDKKIESADDISESDTRPRLRAGYCGHLTQIANRLLRLRDSCPITRKFLDSHAGWKDFVENRLEPRNRVESVFAWQCGRPATHTAGLNSDHLMYHGDLTFSSMDSGSFTKEVYEQYGGLYEEEDEDEDIETSDPVRLKSGWSTLEVDTERSQDNGNQHGESPDAGSNKNDGESLGLYMARSKISSSDSSSDSDDDKDLDNTILSTSDALPARSDSQDRCKETEDIVIVRSPGKDDLVAFDDGLAAEKKGSEDDTIKTGDIPKATKDEKKSPVVGYVGSIHSMEDMQFDAVMMDDFEAAEGLIDLHHDMENLSISKTGSEDTQKCKEKDEKDREASKHVIQDQGTGATVASEQGQ